MFNFVETLIKYYYFKEQISLWAIVVSYVIHRCFKMEQDYMNLHADGISYVQEQQ